MISSNTTDLGMSHLENENKKFTFSWTFVFLQVSPMKFFGWNWMEKVIIGMDFPSKMKKSGLKPEFWNFSEFSPIISENSNDITMNQTTVDRSKLYCPTQTIGQSKIWLVLGTEFWSGYFVGPLENTSVFISDSTVPRQWLTHFNFAQNFNNASIFSASIFGMGLYMVKKVIFTAPPA